MLTRFQLVACTGIVALAFVVPASAGPLATDPSALAGFRGTTHFNSLNVLLVDLDYAVYAPGQYPDDGVNGNDPSGGNEYVYAYQAFNLSPSAALSAFSLALDPNSGARDSGADPLHVLTGGMAPLFSTVTPGSVATAFLPQVPGGGYSQVFLFTSPNPPVFNHAAVIGGGLADQRLAPSPVPEPAAAALLAMVGLTLVRRRRN